MYGEAHPGRAVFQRDGREEGSRLHTHSQVIARIGTELQIRFRQPDRILVGIAPRGGIEVQPPYLADRRVEGQAQTPELQPGLTLAEAGRAVAAVEHGGCRVGSDRAQVQVQLPGGGTGRRRGQQCRGGKRGSDCCGRISSCPRETDLPWAPDAEASSVAVSTLLCPWHRPTARERASGLAPAFAGATR